MHDKVCAVLLIAVTAGVGAASAQSGSGATWTFSTDSANNLVIQDLEAFNTATGRVGDSLCLRYYPACPSSSARRENDLRLARPRYTLRGTGANGGGKGFEWRVEPGQPTVRDTGATLPFLVGGVEQGMVQTVSAEGPWTIEMQRIPAAELRVGDGKRWNVFLRTSEAPPDPSAQACWIEVGCPSG